MLLCVFFKRTALTAAVKKKIPQKHFAMHSQRTRARTESSDTTSRNQWSHPSDRSQCCSDMSPVTSFLTSITRMRNKMSASMTMNAQPPVNRIPALTTWVRPTPCVCCSGKLATNDRNSVAKLPMISDTIFTTFIRTLSARLLTIMKRSSIITTPTVLYCATVAVNLWCYGCKQLIASRLFLV